MHILVVYVNNIVTFTIYKHRETMTNEEKILLEFKNYAKVETEKANNKTIVSTEAQELRVAPKWNLKPSFNVAIEDVTPEGYGI